MNKGKFRAGMEEAHIFLKKLALVREKNVEMMRYCESSKYSDELKKLSRKNDYRELYQYAIAYNQYDILLKDFSFLQFSFDNDSNVIRMAYFPSPDIVITYEEYLEQNISSDNTAGTDDVELFRQNQWRREEYENYLESQEAWNPVTALRYDYSESEYNGLIHSVSHFHFGQNESIRVPMDKILTPYAFAVCVVSYYYYDVWKNGLSSDEDFERKIITVKQKCGKVSAAYFSEEERRYFHVC